MNTSILKQKMAIQIPAWLVTVIVMQLLPFLVHALPQGNGAPLGARLLPLFYAPFVAAIFFHPMVAIMAGLVAPYLNYLLLGQPTPGIAVILSIQLVFFSASVALLHKYFPRLWFNALISYGVAMLATLAALTILPGRLVPAPAVPFTIQSIITGWEGILILLAFNLLVVVWETRARAEEHDS